MTIVLLIKQGLSGITFIGGILIVLFLVFFIYSNLLKKKSGFADSIWKFIQKNALLLAFVVAFIATLGSLFYSEIAGYEPCKLCWFQRIFMYPQVILLATALIKKARDIAHYVIPLSIVGGLIAGYHYIIQKLSYAASCSADGVSCTSKYVFHYGYITIPMMALTAFILIIVLTYIWKNERRVSYYNMSY